MDARALCIREIAAWRDAADMVAMDGGPRVSRLQHRRTRLHGSLIHACGSIALKPCAVRLANGSRREEVVRDGMLLEPCHLTHMD